MKPLLYLLLPSLVFVLRIISLAEQSGGIRMS